MYDIDNKDNCNLFLIILKEVAGAQVATIIFKSLTQE